MDTSFTKDRLLERGELELVLEEERSLYGVDYILHYIEQTEICVGHVNSFIHLHVFIALSEHTYV